MISLNQGDKMSVLNKHHSIIKPVALFNEISSRSAFEMAKLFVNSGFEIICFDRKIFNFEEIEKSSEIVDKITILHYESDISRSIDMLKRQDKIIDIFIINQEDHLQGPFSEFDSEKVKYFIKKNLMDNLEILRFVINQMKENNHGKIFFYHQMGQRIEAPFESIVMASITFMTSIIKSLRGELRDYQITITELYQNLDSNHEYFPLHKMSEEEFAEECFYALLSSKKHVFHTTLQEKVENFFKHKIIDQTMQIFLN